MKDAPKKAHSRVHQLSVAQFEKQFPHDDACKEYLKQNRWPDGVKCPRCGNANVHEHSGKPYHWNCYVCTETTGYRFSVLSGTIFENTNKPLRDWFRVMHLILTAKKGMSALQIMRYMGFGSYKTAHLMCHKIRFALGNEEFKQLVGAGAVDETFIGGEAKNKHKDKRGYRGGSGGGGPRGGVGSGAAVLAGAVQRKGNVIARVVDHRKGEYVVGAAHTNTIEGFWSMVKGGIMGSFHKVSHRYLWLYVREFEFRYNNRDNNHIFGTAIKAC